MVTLYLALGVVTALGFYAAYQIGLRWTALAGLGVVAYILGLRHGFDADHIAAIDNTTRKLLHEGKRPLTVGTWFSLGHSTIVAGLIVAFVFLTDFIKSHIATFQSVGDLVGAAVSGTFLFLIGFVNLLIVREVYRMFREARAGRMDEARYESQMNQRGILYRLFYRFFRAVEEPRQIYPIGVLFGLGFDTATEVALIAIAVGVGVSGVVPIWTVLVLPLLFTCGMVLSDTSDGFAMRFAYGWAFNHPIRKIFYNLTLTVISVLVAFVVGGVELLQVFALKLGLTGPFWGAIAGVSFGSIGLGIVLLFVGAWGVALLVYRWKGYERAGLSPPPPPRSSSGADSSPPPGAP